MASAVLASRNESSFMGKTPFSNPHLNPNPNSKSLSSSKRHNSANLSQFNGRYNTTTTTDELSAAAVNQSVPDDASSFNRRSYNSTTTATKQNQFNQGEYVSFDIASYRRKELVQLKKRLVAELDRIRILENRIESGEFQLRSSTSQRPSSSKKDEKKGLNKKGGSGTKRSLPLVSGGSGGGAGRDSKRLAPSLESNGNLLKMCGQVLTKLMKHKRGYIFNTPVDVVGLGLHDYNQIVKHPMDLGTVKSNLGKNFYETPVDFASDVRLTFKNAMLYNPKGHEVHELADQLLSRFEELFQPVHQKCESEQQEPPQLLQQQRGNFVEELQESSWNRISTPEKVKKSNVMEIVKKSERMQVPAAAAPIVTTSTPPPMVQSPVPTPSPRRVSPVKPLMRTKLPKPKAKDPNKREMSLEEKHKLGVGLQSLPDEKMTQVVQIIKKRNENLTEDGDEIELDIEAVDTETLWELDRFVTNWKKMVSKIKRQALMGNSAGTADGSDTAVVKAESDVPVAPTKKAKRGEGGEEDVDIGDDIPMSSFPPVEIEKDDGHGHASSSSSSSSGSSSDSSSSSDSDSGSSSGSDSDADNAQSRDFSRT